MSLRPTQKPSRGVKKPVSESRDRTRRALTAAEAKSRPNDKEDDMLRRPPTELAASPVLPPLPRPLTSSSPKIQPRRVLNTPANAAHPGPSSTRGGARASNADPRNEDLDTVSQEVNELDKKHPHPSGPFQATPWPPLPSWGRRLSRYTPSAKNATPSPVAARTLPIKPSNTGLPLDRLSLTPRARIPSSRERSNQDNTLASTAESRPIQERSSRETS